MIIFVFIIKFGIQIKEVCNILFVYFKNYLSFNVTKYIFHLKWEIDITKMETIQRSEVTLERKNTLKQHDMESMAYAVYV